MEPKLCFIYYVMEFWLLSQTSVPDWTLSLVFFCKTWLLKWLNCLRVCCSAASVHPVMDGCVCADTADSLHLIHAPLMYPFAAFFRHVCSSVCCQITTLIGSFYSLLTRGTGCLLKNLTSLEWKKRIFKKLTVAPHQVVGGFSARAPEKQPRVPITRSDLREDPWPSTDMSGRCVWVEPCKKVFN